MRMLCLAVIFMLVAACAAYDGRGLQVGVATVDQVLAAMGAPAMKWRDADGGEQWAMVRGPGGVHTYMTYFDPQGRLKKIENVLEPGHFAQIVAGVSGKAEVLRLLGPSNPAWSIYFESRDELVWEWQVCDEQNTLARFAVLFDGATGLVRTTMQRQDLRGPEGVAPRCGR